MSYIDARWVVAFSLFLFLFAGVIVDRITSSPL